MLRNSATTSDVLSSLPAVQVRLRPSARRFAIQNVVLETWSSSKTTSVGVGRRDRFVVWAAVCLLRDLAPRFPSAFALITSDNQTVMITGFPT